MERQRIDKWLWHVRVVRTRAAAAALAAAGHVRVNGQRIDAASRAVRPGDVVTVSLDRVVRVLKVVGFADRRGSASVAQSLSEEIAQPTCIDGQDAVPAPRETGGGRPTKRERRAIDRFAGNSGQ